MLIRPIQGYSATTPDSLSYYNDDPKPDDLKEDINLHHTGSDGIFNEGDYILFYGKGTTDGFIMKPSKDYDFLSHNYSDTAFYFITSGSAPGKRIIPCIRTCHSLPIISHQNPMLCLFMKLKMKTLSNQEGNGSSQYPSAQVLPSIPDFTDLITSENMKCSIRVAARASIPTQFRLYEGRILKKNHQVQGVNIYNYTGHIPR